MIRIIYGEKGTGKTKQIVDSANQSAKTAKGVVVYIDKDSTRMHDLDGAIRLVDTSQYGIKTQTDLVAFVKGMLACNFDIEYVYIDGMAKIVDSTIDKMKTVYEGIEEISKQHNINFVITASCAKENLPTFVKKHAK